MSWKTLDNRLGGMLLFLNHGEGETHLSAPVADALLHLCNAVASGDKRKRKRVPAPRLHALLGGSRVLVSRPETAHEVVMIIGTSLT